MTTPPTTLMDRLRAVNPYLHDHFGHLAEPMQTACWGRCAEGINDEKAVRDLAYLEDLDRCVRYGKLPTEERRREEFLLALKLARGMMEGKIDEGLADFRQMGRTAKTN